MLNTQRRGSDPDICWSFIAKIVNDYNCLLYPQEVFIVCV